MQTRATGRPAQGLRRVRMWWPGSRTTAAAKPWGRCGRSSKRRQRLKNSMMPLNAAPLRVLPPKGTEVACLVADAGRVDQRQTAAGTPGALRQAAGSSGNDRTSSALLRL
ncbi:MAG: hypothetical protein J2P48_12865 [Alphaproteobacteria bacterium]|nr:hypothetical protein [Alphaproteobacteria bacterium]